MRACICSLSSLFFFHQNISTNMNVCFSYITELVLCVLIFSNMVIDHLVNHPLHSHHLNMLTPLASKAEAMKPLTAGSGISKAIFLAVKYEHPIADNAKIDAVRNFMFPMA